MFNPQLDFDTFIPFDGKNYPLTQRQVTILNSCPPISGLSFLKLNKGDVFTATDVDGEQITDEEGNTIFVAVSNPYRDELGIPCIDIEPTSLDF